MTSTRILWRIPQDQCRRWVFELTIENPYTTSVPPPDSMICFNTFTYTLFWLTLCRMVLGHIRYQIMCIDKP
jgi:hypothetical protein